MGRGTPKKPTASCSLRTDADAPPRCLPRCQWTPLRALELDGAHGGHLASPCLGARAQRGGLFEGIRAISAPWLLTDAAWTARRHSASTSAWLKAAQRVETSSRAPDHSSTRSGFASLWAAPCWAKSSRRLSGEGGSTSTCVRGRQRKVRDGDQNGAGRCREPRHAPQHGSIIAPASIRSEWRR